MIKLKRLILSENGENDNTFRMYHGGKRWSRIPTEILGSKEGRYEAGPGIYMTNDYYIARRYAKGSRVVHLVDIDRNFTPLDKVHILLSELIEFVKNCGGMRHKAEIIDALKKNAERMRSDTVGADILNNLIVNFRSGAGKVGIAVANYFISKGGDSKIEKQSGDEMCLIIFRPNIIKKVSVIDPSKITSDFEFTLPPINNINI
jgi:hypothetical protein